MRDLYSTPLNSRYASKEMSFIFSDDMKFTTWRKLWLALAESEKELGLNITDKQIEELREHVNDINYEDLVIAKIFFNLMSKRKGDNTPWCN